MKYKKYLYLGLCLLAVICAFAAPWATLSIMEHSAEKTVETVQSSDNLVNYGELSVAKKQAIRGSSILDSNILISSGHEEIIDLVIAELEKLLDYGAITDYFFNIFLERLSGANINRYLWVYSQNKAFSYYEITEGVEGGWLAIFDEESGKILHLGLAYDDADLYWEYILESGSHPLFEEQIRAWAEYYGLVVQDVRLSSAESTDDMHSFPYYLASCVLTDEEGTQFEFHLSYSPDYDICWGVNF